MSTAFMSSIGLFEDFPAECPDLEVRVDLPGIKVGVIEASGIEATSMAPELHREIDTACERVRTQYSCDSLRLWEPVRMVREAFKAWGMDPSKYRASSEALLRRVIKSGALPKFRQS